LHQNGATKWLIFSTKSSIMVLNKTIKKTKRCR
jgi:hypothetical protein